MNNCGTSGTPLSNFVVRSSKNRNQSWLLAVGTVILFVCTLLPSASFALVVNGPSCADMGLVELGGVCRYPDNVYDTVLFQPGGGGTGGSGGGNFGTGGGGIPGVIPIPNNPLNQNTNASCDTPELAVPYAVAEVGPVLSQLDPGDYVLIQYRNGQTEIFEVICTFCSIPVAPVPGTCS